MDKDDLKFYIEELRGGAESYRVGARYGGELEYRMADAVADKMEDIAEDLERFLED